MGKAGKWIKSLITGGKKDKVDKEKETSNKNSVTPVVIPAGTPKEKKRWSFRRSSATAPGPKDSSSNESTPTKPGRPPTSASPHLDDEQQKPDVTVTSAENSAGMAEETQKAVLIQEAAAAIRIQSVFRSYLARKALRALRGLVKIQALVRGHLVRKHTTATLRRMQAIVTAQARARAHRIRSVEEDNNNLFTHHRHSTHKINNHHHFNFTNSSYQEFENGMMEESIKIVEMDLGGESKPSSRMRLSYPNNDRTDSRFSTYYTPQFDYTNQDFHKISPAPSAITDISPRTCSGHFEDCLFPTAQSSPQCYYSAVSRPDPSRTPFAFPRQEYSDSLSYDYPLYPNYMANTQSSRAKARSQSAPKQRPESFERQLSKRRPSVEGRNIPRAVRMQRSSSQVGAAAAAQNYQLPWSIKLDKSTVSLKDSECGSACSALTNGNYCRTVISYDPQGNRY